MAEQKITVGSLVLHPVLTWWGLGEVLEFTWSTMVDRNGVEVQKVEMARVKWSHADTYSYTPVCDLIPTDVVSAVGTLVNPVYRVVLKRRPASLEGSPGSP